MITLTHKSIELIVLPKIGGTIVSLKKNNCNNILKSDKTLWNDSEQDKPALNAFSNFKAYNGHTIWVGPQSEWWTNQDLNHQRNAEKSMWPPDPFLIYGEYTVVSQSQNTLHINSPLSPVSGVQLSKEIAINDDESIYIHITLTNALSKPIKWDIWFNTRMDGFSKAYVPVTNTADIKIEHVLNERSHEMPCLHSNNYFNYSPIIPDTKFSERSSKTYIYPSKPFMIGFTETHALKIQFEKHAKELIHPEHGMVEFYNHTEHDEHASLLELEYHSPYQTILPGKSIEAWEVWDIFEYSGKNLRESHIKFINEIDLH